MENSFQDSGSTHSQLIGTKFLRSWNSSEPKCLSRHICMELRSHLCVFMSVYLLISSTCLCVCLFVAMVVLVLAPPTPALSFSVTIFVCPHVCLSVCLYICLTVSSVWSLSVLYVIVVCVSFYPEQWLDGVCPSRCPPALSSPSLLAFQATPAPRRH